LGAEPVFDSAEVDATRLKVIEQLRDVGERAADAVELLAGKRVAWVECREGLLQDGSVVADAGCLLDEDPFDGHPELLGGVELEVGLLITRRDAGIEDRLGHGHDDLSCGHSRWH
jgi:hypothetical protein